MGAIEAGESCRSVATRFGIAMSSAVKWAQRYRSSGSVAPGKMRRLKALKGLTPYEFICKTWTSQPERFRLNPLQCWD